MLPSPYSGSGIAALLCGGITKHIGSARSRWTGWLSIRVAMGGYCISEHISSSSSRCTGWLTIGNAVCRCRVAEHIRSAGSGSTSGSSVFITMSSHGISEHIGLWCCGSADIILCECRNGCEHTSRECWNDLLHNLECFIVDVVNLYPYIKTREKVNRIMNLFAMSYFQYTTWIVNFNFTKAAEDALP